MTLDNFDLHGHLKPTNSLCFKYSILRVLKPKALRSTWGSVWFPLAESSQIKTSVLFGVDIIGISEIDGKIFCHLKIWTCKFALSFSQWKLTPSLRRRYSLPNLKCVNSPSHMYIFWNYSHFCLLSKVNIHVLFNEYLLTLSPTLYCVWTNELRFKSLGNGKVF